MPIELRKESKPFYVNKSSLSKYSQPYPQEEKCKSQADPFQNNKELLKTKQWETSTRLNILENIMMYKKQRKRCNYPRQCRASMNFQPTTEQKNSKRWS